jgi:hypothetical protein
MAMTANAPQEGGAGNVAFQQQQQFICDGNLPSGHLLTLRYSGWGNSEYWIGWAADAGPFEGAIAEGRAVPQAPSVDPIQGFPAE